MIQLFSLFDINGTRRWIMRRKRNGFVQIYRAFTCDPIPSSVPAKLRLAINFSVAFRERTALIFLPYVNSEHLSLLIAKRPIFIVMWFFRRVNFFSQNCLPAIDIVVKGSPFKASMYVQFVTFSWKTISQ